MSIYIIVDETLNVVGEPFTLNRRTIRLPNGDIVTSPKNLTDEQLIEQGIYPVVVMNKPTIEENVDGSNYVVIENVEVQQTLILSPVNIENRKTKLKELMEDKFIRSLRSVEDASTKGFDRDEFRELYLQALDYQNNSVIGDLLQEELDVRTSETASTLSTKIINFRNSRKQKKNAVINRMEIEFAEIDALTTNAELVQYARQKRIRMQR